jgi:hypothetical protein
MKLTCEGIQFETIRDEVPTAALLVQMRGESGEVYHFGHTFTDDKRIEDILRSTADQIAATRRKRPAPKYKVKSIMPGKDFTTVEVNGVKYSR